METQHTEPTTTQENAVLVTTTEPTNPDVDSKSRSKLIWIGVIAYAIIVVIIIVSVTVAITTSDYSDHWDGCGCSLERVDFYNDGSDDICGKEQEAITNSTMCPDACESEYDDNLREVYFITNTSECFCYSYTMWRENYDGIVDHCEYDASVNISNLDVMQWSQFCCADGRPYNIETESNIQSGLKTISCQDYTYFAHDEWIDFIQSSNHSDYGLYNKWKKKALAEYASIATFSKFSLQLMSIGAPLWFIQLSNEAGLDEIRHSQISLDIANMYLNDNDGQCIMFDVFPQHQIDIDADWNEIAMDTAIGGCIGETLAALNMFDDDDGYENNDIVGKYVHNIANDEIRHAALAWITVKWIIDNAPMDVKVSVKDGEWWDKQLEMRTLSNRHKGVVQSILMKLKMDIDYKKLYQFIVDEIQFNAKPVERCVLS